MTTDEQLDEIWKYRKAQEGQLRAKVQAEVGKFTKVVLAAKMSRINHETGQIVSDLMAERYMSRHAVAADILGHSTPTQAFRYIVGPDGKPLPIVNQEQAILEAVGNLVAALDEIVPPSLLAMPSSLDQPDAIVTPLKKD